MTKLHASSFFARPTSSSVPESLLFAVRAIRTLDSCILLHVLSVDINGTYFTNLATVPYRHYHQTRQQIGNGFLKRPSMFPQNMAKICSLLSLMTLFVFRVDAACPCFCKTKFSKRSDLCLAQAGFCKIVRCRPSSSGLACCDGKTTPKPPPTRSQAVENFKIIAKFGQGAAKGSPSLSRRLVSTLRKYKEDVSRVPDTSQTQHTTRMRKKGRSSSSAFLKFKAWTGNNLQYMYSTIQKHFT